MDKKLRKYIKILQERGEYGAYVGRLNPMHSGHQALINLLLEAFPTKHLIGIGSCSHSVSIRHLFRFSDRGTFILSIFPTARIAPLPDFESDDDWFYALETLLRLSGMEPSKTVFIGGCDEDVNFYNGRGYKVEIINRFDGTTTNVSGTEIRDRLIHDRSLDQLIDPKIAALVKERFKARWAEAIKQ